VMEFLVAGCSAVQIGTANFYNPQATMKLLDALPAALAELGALSVNAIVGSLASKPSGAAHQPDPSVPVSRNLSIP